MKILFIVPGSGDPFYCGNCFRDNLHANTLKRAGHEVMVMPLYLPLRHSSFHEDTPLFFPATSFYLAKKIFRRKGMPHWMRKMLSSNLLLRLAASFSGSTSAKGLEDITLSMIYGDDAAFSGMAAELTGWITQHEKPDVIHLSSSLVIGIARAIKQQCDIPIVCSLQDEEIWIEALEEKFGRQAWEGIAANLKHVDQFVVSSEFYKKTAQERIPAIKEIEVVYPGVNREKYASDDYPKAPVIGFFYRMNSENGLGILAEAFIKLKKSGTLPGLKLKVGGGYTSADKKFLKKVRKSLAPYMDDIEWSHTYSLDDHAAFYREISAICVPVTFDEGIGLYLCEAFAAGRPAVEPDTGSFREIVANAGIVYHPNGSDALASALEKLLSGDIPYQEYCQRALQLSEKRYNDAVAVEKLLAVYGKFIP